jgi:preprotein translocase subunit SecD
MNRYPLWAYVLLTAITVFGLIYSLPNVFGEDVAVQVSHEGGAPLGADIEAKVAGLLSADKITNRGILNEEGRLLVRVPDEETQLKAADALKRGLGQDYVVALNLASRTPVWLAALGAKPMALGLDLRGGVHFLLQVDLEAAQKLARERMVRDLPRYLRRERLRYADAIEQADGLLLVFADDASRSKAREVITAEFSELNLADEQAAAGPALRFRLSEEEIKRIQANALDQNLSTLRNRVNELGVAEPVVQRQGADRIVVQLPGIQDSAEAKRILGKTATLEYRLVALDGDTERAARTGIAPPGTELFYDRDQRPILLVRDVIATGDQVVDATSGLDQESGSPAVFITLDGTAAKSMLDTTQKNLKKPMAVLFIENKTEIRYENGQEIRDKVTVKEVISVATIQGVFGKRFQTTGLMAQEAKDLALLMRAGALAVPVDIIEERTVGPSLGKDNIRRGTLAAAIGLLGTLLFVGFYYQVFGLIANVALLVNLVLTVAAMSLLQATLTLPGIAGLVLSLAMAVDANVLICERIREELDSGKSPLAAIKAGYDRAFITIVDANLTTLIAAVACFALGSGPVKGFAVTLILGIVISMTTAITGTRAIVHLVYGGQRRVKMLAI